MAAKPVPSTEAKTLGGIVEETVESGSTFYTDGSSCHGSPWEFTLDAVNHGAGESVRGAVHTNRIKGFLSMFKRGYYGI